MSPGISPESTERTDRPALKEWVRRLTEQEMPIFSQTAMEIARVLHTEEYSSLSLARVVLQDASMTAKVLKLANSAFYNPGGVAISTVSRAVMVLGFNQVQAMCLSIAVIESLVQGNAKERVLREMARSVHAATQARAVALMRNDKSPEEVFVSTLLYHLGDMAFWCFAGDQGDELDKKLRAPGAVAVEVEKEVLGFRLVHLTAEIAKEWKLSDLLVRSLMNPAQDDPRVKSITLSHDLATASEKGWKTAEAKLATEKIANLTKASMADVQEMVEQSARDAVETARALGAKSVSHLIPIPGQPGGLKGIPDDESESSAGGFAEPDPALQLRILREITQLLGTATNFNSLLEMVLEGIHRGIGMDRTAFALMTPRRNALKAKFVLGYRPKIFVDRFQLEINPRMPHLFSVLIDRNKSAWIKNQKSPEYQALLPKHIVEMLDGAPFFAMPVVLNGQAIGLFYSDRGQSGRELDQDTFDSFQHFVMQANLGLEHLSQRMRKS